MKTRKRLLCVLLIAVMTVLLTGCYGSDAKITIRTDGTGSMSLCFMVDSTMNKYMVESGEYEGYFPDYKVSEKTYNNNIYTCYEKTVLFASPEELKAMLTDYSTYNKKFAMWGAGENKELEEEYSADSCLFSSAYATADSFQAVVEGGSTSELVDGSTYDDPMLKDIFMLVSITFDKEIAYTNGTLSSDKKTASWKLSLAVKDTLLQASTIGKEAFSSETNAPVITGVTNEKYYKKNVTVSISDDVGIETATCNGKEIGREHEADLDGKYVIEAIDFSGNKTSKTFWVDTVEPSVSGVVNGRTYKTKRTIKFTDTCGVKTATLNGKTIKSGKVVSKAGTYTLKVKDKAGNLKTVRFKIKK